MWSVKFINKNTGIEKIKKCGSSIEAIAYIAILQKYYRTEPLKIMLTKGL